MVFMTEKIIAVVVADLSYILTQCSHNILFYHVIGSIYIKLSFVQDLKHMKPSSQGMLLLSLQ